MARWNGRSVGWRYGGFGSLGFRGRDPWEKGSLSHHVFMASGWEQPGRVGDGRYGTTSSWACTSTRLILPLKLWLSSLCIHERFSFSKAAWSRRSIPTHLVDPVRVSLIDPKLFHHVHETSDARCIGTVSKASERETAFRHGYGPVEHVSRDETCVHPVRHDSDPVFSIQQGSTWHLVDPTRIQKPRRNASTRSSRVPDSEEGVGIRWKRWNAPSLPCIASSKSDETRMANPRICRFPVRTKSSRKTGREKQEGSTVG